MSLSYRLHTIHDRYVSYDDGLAQQKLLHQRRRRDEVPDTLLLLEHSHVVTIGRSSHPETDFIKSQTELKEIGIEVYDADRGGELTYHAPGQLVGYPIIELRDELGERDLHVYLRNLEEIIIGTLGAFGVRGERRPGLTGVWVGNEKIAAIGIKVSRWVTMHGFALNVNLDLTPMRSYIIPCGIRTLGVTSLAEIGVTATREDVEPILVDNFEKVLNRTLILDEV